MRCIPSRGDISFGRNNTACSTCASGPTPAHAPKTPNPSETTTLQICTCLTHKCERHERQAAARRRGVCTHMCSWMAPWNLRQGSPNHGSSPLTPKSRGLLKLRLKTWSGGPRSPRWPHVVRQKQICGSGRFRRNPELRRDSVQVPEAHHSSTQEKSTRHREYLPRP